MKQNLNNFLQPMKTPGDRPNSTGCAKLQLQINEMKTRYGQAGSSLAVFMPQREPAGLIRTEYLSVAGKNHPLSGSLLATKKVNIMP
jgi:hypothetical protein